MEYAYDSAYQMESDPNRLIQFLSATWVDERGVSAAQGRGRDKTPPGSRKEAKQRSQPFPDGYELSYVGELGTLPIWARIGSRPQTALSIQRRSADASSS